MLEHPISKEGWTRVRFDQISMQINDRVDNPAAAGVERYVGLEHLDPDSLRIRRWGEPTDVESTKLRFQPGDIIFGKRRVYQRKVAVADFEGICSAHAMVLRAKPGAVLPDFLPFFMQSDLFMERALSISVGSLSPTINWKALAAEEFLLPPIQEQARLVAVLSAYRNADENLAVAAENLSAMRMAYVSNILDLHGNAAARVSVSSLLVDGPTNGRSPAPSDSVTGFKTVSISAIRNGIFDPEGCIKFVEMTSTEARPFIVQSGDIFAVRGNGNREICGKVGISRETYPDLIYPDLLIRMRFDPSRLLNDFVVAQWNHPVIHGRLISRAKSSNGIWKVNGQDIRAHALVVPPMDVQQEAVQFLEALYSQARAIQARFAALRYMKRELFKAISGGDE